MRRSSPRAQYLAGAASRSTIDDGARVIAGDQLTARRSPIWSRGLSRRGQRGSSPVLQLGPPPAGGCRRDTSCTTHAASCPSSSEPTDRTRPPGRPGRRRRARCGRRPRSPPGDSDEVPGMSRMCSSRWSSHARAICAGVAACFVATEEIVTSSASGFGPPVMRTRSGRRGRMGCRGGVAQRMCGERASHTSTLALGVAERLRRIADRLNPPSDRDPSPSDACLCASPAGGSSTSAARGRTRAAVVRGRAGRAAVRSRPGARRA
jgi:hypothetical protein